MPVSTPPLDPAWVAVLLIAGAAVSWYVAAHAAAAVLASRASAFILAGGLPALAGACWFTLTGRTEAALALALGVAMASATLVMGIISNADPLTGQRIIDDPSRRLKATLLPAAIILLVAGFGGELTLLHAVLLLIAGGVVAWLGLAGRGDVPVATVVEPEESSPPEPPIVVRAVQLLLAAILAIAGAGLAAGAAAAASRRQGMELDATFATVLVSAIVALPLIGIGTRFVAVGQGPVAQRGLTLIAVYMLCLAVPVIILLDVGQQLFPRGETAPDLHLLYQRLKDGPAVPMPLRLWRTDSVMLCLAGLLLLPPAAGRYRLGKIEGVALILLFVVYLLITLMATRGT